MNLVTIIPSFHGIGMTHSLMADLAREEMRVLVVDNGGDYIKRYDEFVLRLGENLGWLRGCNYGMEFLNKNFPNVDGVILLNNDTHLSNGFHEGIKTALELYPTVGLLAPAYNDVHKHQHPLSGYTGMAEWYVPQNTERIVNFVDGTCMVIPTYTLKSVGYLDEEHFGNYGWGADYDYAIRVREADLDVLVTERAYVWHFRQGTAGQIPNYEGLAGQEMVAGMHKKYGPDWAARI